jgi:hypothetical protein
MNTCKTCKHWEPEDRRYLPKNLIINIGECGLISVSEGIVSNDKLAASKAHGDYCGASLQTAENFGCVLWKASEPEDSTIEAPK